MKIFSVTVECSTAEELSQSLRIAADTVREDIPFFTALAVDDGVQITDEPDVSIQRHE